MASPGNSSRGLSARGPSSPTSLLLKSPALAKISFLSLPTSPQTKASAQANTSSSSKLVPNLSSALPPSLPLLTLLSSTLAHLVPPPPPRLLPPPLLPPPPPPPPRPPPPLLLVLRLLTTLNAVDQPILVPLPASLLTFAHTRTTSTASACKPSAVVSRYHRYAS